MFVCGELKNEIENIRSTLFNLLENKLEDGYYSEAVLELSKRLDVLIVDYMKSLV